MFSESESIMQNISSFRLDVRKILHLQYCESHNLNIVMDLNNVVAPPISFSFFFGIFDLDQQLLSAPLVFKNKFALAILKFACPQIPY